ncbi:MAG: HDOD domain-containing protein [Phycisphaerae bacterium]|nr:HDOD domain-containing protein [Phycisphaerae bacterium]
MSTAQSNTAALSTHQLDLMLRPVERLFTLPVVAARVMEAFHSRPEDVAGLAMLDPALCARMLMVEGPAAIADGGASLDVDRLMEELLAMPVLPSPAGGAAGEFPSSALWVHCLAVGVLARELVGRVRPDVEPALAFACGLLHDAGKLAAVLCVPKSYQRALEKAALGPADVTAVEREVLGVDHATIGRRLAGQWRLPQAVGDAMWLHHQPAAALPMELPHRDLVAAVALADRLARQRAFGHSGNEAVVAIESTELSPFGLDLDSLENFLIPVSARIDELSRRLGLHEAAPRERHYQALLHVNRALSVRNAALSRERASLQSHARAFSHVSEFAVSLGPDARISDVLPRIATIAAETLNVPSHVGTPLIAYAVDSAAGQLLAVRLWDGQPQWRIASLPPVVELPDAAFVASSSTLPVDAEEFDDWLPPGFVHRPLACAGRWVGGLLAPAGASRADEADEIMLSWMACALATVQGRGQAAELSEQLAGASRAHAADQQALAHTRALAAVGEMAAGAAHELNTPLAVLSGRSQLMLKKANTDEERRLWQTMSEQSQKISDIITELMEFASPSAPAAEAFDAWEILRQASSDFRSDTQASALTADIEGSPVPVWVWADRRQVLSVLREVLSNAATAAEGPVTVRLSARADEAGRVTLTVADNGPGMAPAVAAKAFEPFFSHQRAGRRRGLGLPRARRIIQANGGEIDLRTAPGCGTTVTVQLPAAKRTLEEDGDAPGG